MNEKVIIDANVIIEGNYLELPFDKIFTTPKISEEIKDHLSGIRFDIEDITIESPEEKFVKKISDRSGSMDKNLSDADISALALAMQKDLPIITDDFAMQDVAKSLEIEFKGFLEQRYDRKT